MLATKQYQRGRAVEYAKKWALDRNPLFAVYDGLGGDCTNFVSQCILAGSCQMNYSPVFGWYYVDSADRTASWTGVEFFYNFITRTEGAELETNTGPYGHIVGESELDIGDVIQLGDKRGIWYHTLIVTGFGKGTYLIAAHSDDSLDRPLDTYTYYQARFIKIDGVNIGVPDREDCFEDLLNGVKLPTEKTPPAIIPDGIGILPRMNIPSVE